MRGSLRVLLIANNFPPEGYIGGAEVASYHSLKGLRRQGVDVAALAVNARMPEPVDKWYAFDGIPVHRVHFFTERRRPWRDVFDPRVYRTVRRALRRVRPDLVHIHNVAGASLAPFVACRRAGVPVVNTLHDLWLLCPNNMLYRRDGSFCDPCERPQGCRDCFRRYDFWGDVPLRRRVFRALTANVRRFLSPSQAVIDRHVEAGYDPARFRRVRLGFEPARVQTPTHPDVCRWIATARRAPSVAFAGGGVTVKGAQVLLDALPLLLPHVPGLRVAVAGGGDARLLNAFRRFEPQVWVLGRVPFPEMRAFFGAADLSLVPSVWHENSPVVIFENFQMGTPVVGSDFGGIPEFIEPGATGYLFPRGDSAALAERVIRHFARPARARRRMRQACYRFVQTALTWERHVAGTLAVYDEVVAA